LALDLVFEMLTVSCVDAGLGEMEYL